MQTPSTATLRRLTEAVNARVAEEFKLFELDVTPPKLSPGIVRAAWQVMAEQIEVDLETESLRNEVVQAVPAGQHIRFESESRMTGMLNALGKQLADDPATTTTADDNADPYDVAERMVKGDTADRAKRIDALVEKIREAETPEPAHTTAAPKPTTPKRNRSQFGSIPPEELKAKAYEFIRSLAADGIMPRQTEYDAARPDDLPGRMRLCQLLGQSWAEIAKELGLTMLTPQQRMSRSNQAKADAEPAAETPEPAPEEPKPEPAQLRQPSVPRVPDAQVVPARVVEVEPVKPKPAQPSYIEQQAFARRKLRVDVFNFLRKLAPAGVMPTIDEYNARRPSTLPDAKEVMNRLAYTSWEEVAADVPLVIKGRVPSHSRQRHRHSVA